MEKFDLVIIGGGPAGYEAARMAGTNGLRTALIEKDLLGGTCLNRGCIPTKTMLHAALLYAQAEKAGNMGISAQGLQFDMEQLAAHRDEIIEKLRNGVSLLMKTSRVTVISGVGAVAAPHRVSVKKTGAPDEETEVIEAEYILVCTGSYPSRLPVPGMELDGVMTSDEIFSYNKLPQSLAIIGGGVIGMEFASVYSALGCKVTVIEFLDRILANMDREISQNLKMILKKRGVDIHTGAGVKEIRKENDALVCVYEEKGAIKECRAQAVLAATGRKPCIDGVFAEGCQPETRRGHIVTDEYGRTNIPGIYAAGDLTCGIQLAHAASAEAMNSVAHILWERQRSGGDSSQAEASAFSPAFCADVIPACVYTDPEIASVGITQDEAKAAGIDVAVKKYPMSANGKSVLTEQERGFIKIVAAAETHRVLGAQMMCARATDLIGEFCTAIVNGLTLEQLGQVVRPHPTFCEAITEAARL